MNKDITLDRLYKLINVNLTVNDNYDNFEVVLQRLLHAIEVITNSEVTSLLVYEPNKKDLYFRYGTGATAHDLIGLKVPQGQGIAHTVAETKKGVVVNNPEEFGHYTSIDAKLDYKTQRLMAFPVLDNRGEVFGIVETCNKKNNEEYTDDDFQLLKIFCQQAEKTIRHALHIHTLKKQLVKLNSAVEELRTPPLLYTSKEMKNIVLLINKIAPTDTPLLITGDIGTGKTLLTKHIHKDNHRNTHPLVNVDCKLLKSKFITDEMISIQLWGVDKNHKSGVKKSQVGLIPSAAGGTVVLDNVESLPLASQKQLMELLHHKLYFKTYSKESDTLDVRVICTTTQDINILVAENKFEEELFFHINSLSINLTPINSRIEDLQVIAEHYIKKFIDMYHKGITSIDEKVYSILKRYNWPYNLHSLINTLEYLVLYCDTDILTSEYVGEYMFNVMGGGDKTQDILHLDDEETVTLKEAVNRFKTQYIHKVLLQNNWNHTKTSKLLDIQRSYLSRLVKEYELKNKSKK